MSYIGNPIISTDFPRETFSGNGSTTAFAMSIAPASVNAVIVVVSGITQDPSTYTISGTTLTFSAAPPTGTSNISVRHLGVAGIPNTPSAGSVVNASMSTGAPYWDTSGNVGVGTTSPTEKLDVIGNADTTLRLRASSDTALILNETTPNKTWKVKSSDGGLYFQYSSTAYNSGYSSKMSLDSSGNLSFNSGYGSNATAYGCRAWVNFNGSGTPAIRASGNVSSITDDGTGLFRVNMTTAMPDINYSISASVSPDSGTNFCIVNIDSASGASPTAPTTSAFRLQIIKYTGATYNDPTYINCAVFR